MLHLRNKPKCLLLRHLIIAKVKLLQLDKVRILSKHLSMESCKLIPSKVKSLELSYLPDSLEQESRVHQRRVGGELVGRKVELFKVLELLYVFW